MVNPVQETLRGVGKILHRSAAGPALPEPAIQLPSPEERSQMKRHTEGGETLAPGVSFVLSWQDNNGDPQEEAIPAWERKSDSPERKCYDTDLPTWFIAKAQGIIDTRLKPQITAYYHPHRNKFSVMARSEVSNGIPQLFDLSPQLEKIGVGLNMRVAPPQRH